MKKIFALTIAAIVGLAMFAPSPVKAGPIIYRGGPWDRWVSPVVSAVTGDYWASGYYYPGYASSYYYPSTSYYYPSTGYDYPSTSYYYPSTSYYYPSTTYYYPWTSSYYYTTPTYYYGRRGWRWR
jgi:hypothetical protein